ncbi:MAG TPA: hypothetical protein VGZ47_17085 [Gemmataceae bacterium]|nr:hypothetical protein [Gemmataceae bacterium]
MSEKVREKAREKLQVRDCKRVNMTISELLNGKGIAQVVDPSVGQSRAQYFLPGGQKQMVS